ncbi:MAG: FAD-binding protein, partial [Acidimicrobiales bacterium]
MRIAALVKQVPAFETMEIGPDGRLVREGLPLEMNPYCRRAVAQGVELARATGGTCTVVTMGPSSAEDCLREAIAWGCDDGVLISDPAFAGSDTLATARTLAAALACLDPFDLVLMGRNSVDADTGQVPPQLAQLHDVAFAAGVRRLTIDDEIARVRCEEDDGYSERIVRLPAVMSCAERLCDPAKVDPAGRAAVSADRIRILRAVDLGPGRWGEDASGTYVGEVRELALQRERRMLVGPVAQQVTDAVKLLADRGALDVSVAAVGPSALGGPLGTAGPTVAAVVEPDRPTVGRELLGAAHALASAIGGHVAAVVAGEAHDPVASWGADSVVGVEGARSEEDVAAALVAWAGRTRPWAVLLPGTMWGREVGGRAAAALGAGLIGDAIELEVATVASTGERQLLAWKPAFGGRLVAAIYCSTAIQMATVRAGVLAVPATRAATPVRVEQVSVASRGRVEVLSTLRDDDIDTLAGARVVVGVGAGVAPQDYPTIDALAAVLGAEIAATRKVTDNAWMPRARQVGITGR